MDPIIDLQEKEKSKIYSMRSVWVGTFLGGPLTAGYLIAENYKALGENEKVTTTWSIAITFTVVLFAGLFMMPANVNIPNQVIPLIYTAIAYAIVSKIQGEKLKLFMSESGEAFSIWRTVGISLIWACVTFAPIVAYATLTDPVLTASTKTYGRLNHEILYDERKISPEEVDKVADALTKATFFDDEQQKGVLLEKKDNSYIISVPVVGNLWNDQEVIEYLQALRDNVQDLLPEQRIVLNVCSEEDISQVLIVLDRAAP